MDAQSGPGQLTTSGWASTHNPQWPARPPPVVEMKDLQVEGLHLLRQGVSATLIALKG